MVQSKSKELTTCTYYKAILFNRHFSGLFSRDFNITGCYDYIKNGVASE